MTVKVIVEFTVKPGKRAELRSLLESISANHGPSAAGFLGSTVYEVLDSPDALIEIADWESSEARAAAMEQATATEVHTPVNELLASPFRATVISQRS